MSSVFLWDLDDGGFAGVVLLKKGTLLNLTTIPGSCLTLISFLPTLSFECQLCDRAVRLLGLNPWI